MTNTMDVTIVAQFQGLDDAVQGLIVVLIVVGWIFGPLAKKLIQKFSPPQEPSEPDARRPRAPARPGQVAPPRRTAPMHPVARPLPGGVPPPPMRTEELVPPVAQRRRETRIETILERLADSLSEAPEAPVPPVPPPQVQRPPAQPPTRAKPQAPRSLQPGQAPVKPRRDRVEERMGRLQPSVADRLGHLDTSIDAEVAAQSAGIEQRLQHMESELAVAEDLAAEDAAGAHEAVREPAREVADPGFAGVVGLPRLTRQSLRSAVLLREILGPPRAIRPPE